MPTNAEKDRQALADAHPDAFIPVKEGDALEGKVTDVTMGWSDEKSAYYPILTVQTADGTEKKVFAFHTSLANEILSRRPLPGETIRLRFDGLGEAKVKGRNAPYRYTFRVLGRGAAEYARMYDRMASTDPRQAVGAPAPAPAPDMPADTDGLPGGDSIPWD